MGSKKLTVKTKDNLDFNKLKEQDFLSSYIHDKPDIVRFLLKLTLRAAKSNRKNLIYNPAYPGLNNDLLNIDIHTIIDSVSNCDNDQDLPITNEEYKFIVFSIYATPIIFEKTSILNVPKLEQFKVLNTYEKESQFKDETKKHDGKTCYLFHGSRMENWYSMIKNGIKVCSGTKLQVNGAAYGNGIYLSNSIQFSMSYSDTGIMGVFEVCGDRDQYKKTSQIYVVPKESQLILRYFICYDTINKNNIISQINNFFSTEIYKKKEAVKKKKVQFSNGRLMNEINNLLGDKFTLGKEMNVINIDLKPNDFDKDLTLYRDLIKYKIPKVQLEMRIPKGYPFEPPFVWLKNPVFKNRTGHVTDGGSICVDFLTAAAWSPCLSIQKVTLNITTLLSGGEIDHNTHRRYTYQTASSAFHRVARDHGWLR